jgi:hypothetical protein
MYEMRGYLCCIGFNGTLLNIDKVRPFAPKSTGRLPVRVQTFAVTDFHKLWCKYCE